MPSISLTAAIPLALFYANACWEGAGLGKLQRPEWMNTCRRGCHSYTIEDCIREEGAKSRSMLNHKT